MTYDYSNIPSPYDYEASRAEWSYWREMPYDRPKETQFSKRSLFWARLIGMMIAIPTTIGGVYLVWDQWYSGQVGYDPNAPTKAVFKHGSLGGIQSEYLGVLIALCVLIVYFFPSLVAFDSRRKDASGIFVVNLLAGWTVFGWVLALRSAAAKD